MGLVPNVDPAIALNLLHRALEFQVTYGAVLLSFLGKQHFEILGCGVRLRVPFQGRCTGD